MQYIGEYLLTTNSIGNEQDQLQKQFIFTPDMYDVPSSDLENIFAVKNNVHMPHRYDTLTENSGYVVDTIEINKKVTQDDGDADKFCSYIVTATYDLKENVRKRDSGGGGSGNGSDDNTKVDKNGNPADENTAPWDLKVDVNFQPSEVKVPFEKALSGDVYSVNVVNSAGQWLRSDTSRYRREITWTKSFSTYQTAFSNLSSAVINSDTYNLYINPDTTNPLMKFAPETALLLPPACSIRYWKHKVGDVFLNTKYFVYSFRLIYDPQTWKKKLLDVGTWAKFGTNTNPEQIYQETVVNNGTSTINYVNLSTALQHKKQYDQQSINYSYQAVSQDLPLTATGAVFEAAIKNPGQNPYRVLTFDQYPKRSLTSLIGVI